MRSFALMGVLLFAHFASAAAPPSTRAVTLPDSTSARIGMRFVMLPPGEFVMGSPVTEKQRFENETPHRVRITRPFMVATTHVTVAQFAAFVKETRYVTAAEREGWAYGAWNAKENRWDRLDGASWRKPGFEQREDHPVVHVTWDDAVAFCNWLSDRDHQRYRLPTEAEWEYACRAGGSTAYVWGDDPDAGKGWANGLDQSAKEKFTLFPPFSWSDGYVHTSPVATFKPNAGGLSDMLGNTLQWCSDYFADYPEKDVSIDPTGPTTGKQRNLRGGAFIYGPKHTRCAFRGRNDPDFRNFYIGFRVVLEVR